MLDENLSDLTHVDTFAGIGGFSMALRGLGVKTVATVEVDKHCNQVLARHFPDAAQFNDIQEVKGDDLRAVGFVPERGIYTGGFPCFTACTPVLTARGYLPIEQVVVGDSVLTHKNRWRSVTAVMNRMAPEVVEFSPGMYATPEHRFLAREPQREWRNDIRRYRRRLDVADWQQARHLGGQFVARPVAIPAPTAETPKPPCGLDWWQVGRWVADGYTHAQTLDPIICVGYPKVGRDQHRFGDDWRPVPEKTALKVRLSGGREAGEWLHQHFGYLAHAKTIPAWAFSMPEDDRRDLLEGYWSGDGSVSSSGMRSSSVSPCLSAGIATLAESLNYTVSWFYVRTPDEAMIEGRTVQQRNYWQLHAIPDDGRYSELDGDWRWVKIRNTPTLSVGEVQVFDLTVEEDHSFVANGIAAHNCQDISVAGKGAGLAGNRSRLFWEIIRLLDDLRPRWVILENVPRLLSINGGRDMGTVLGALAELGYGVAWRVLDAQFFGVPQRRRRIFIVGYLGGTGREAAEVLFESEGLRGDSAEGGEAESGSPAEPGDGVEGGRAAVRVVSPLPSQRRRVPSADECDQMVIEGPIASHAIQDPISGDVSPCLSANAYVGVAEKCSTLQGGAVGVTGSTPRQRRAGI